MKQKITITLLLIYFSFSAFSQQLSFSDYAVANIAENLKKDAQCVYRLDEGILEITSPSKYTLKVHQIITILNQEGAEHLHQSLWFDKFNKVDNIQVKMYNSAGNEMQQYNKKDFSVQSYYDGMSLATDDKVMRLSLSAPGYPCTVDVRYTKDVISYIDLPDKYLNNSVSSVEQFRYVVKVPAGLDIRYRTMNINMSPRLENNGKQKIYTWETKDVTVNKIDAGGYAGSTYLPQIEVSPNVFTYDGYKGEFKSWSDFGKWSYALYEDKNTFSPQRTAQIKAMVSGLSDVSSKVKVLYNYLKNNMRYVSIQFGIGGYKPFPANFVDEKKYGDCKALTNYMRNMLSAAGIKSYPALINAGYSEPPVAPEFPRNVFNHVILCVPDGKDSIWLECTSNLNESGFLGSFTEDKNALLLTENGGVIVPTPKSDYNKNTLLTVNNIFLNEEGGAEVKSTLTSSGSFYDLMHQVSQFEGGKQNEIFVKYLHYKEPDEFKLDKENEFLQNHRLNLTTKYARLFDFKAGDKFFFPKSIYALCDEKLTMEDSRKIEYLFHFPYKKADTTIYHLPAGFKADNLPAAKQFADGPLSYTMETEFDQSSNTIKITSVLLLKSNVIQADQYKNICILMNKIEKEESNKLVLIKKE